MMHIHGVPTSEGQVTITWGDRTTPEQRADTEPFVYREGAATVIVVGSLEISVDPESITPDNPISPTCLQPTEHS
jgi:hypothetical protein